MTLPRAAGFAFAWLLSAAAAGAATHAAHEHGVVKLDIAVEPASITVLMASPLANLIGFEHAPRNTAERTRADAAIESLKTADALLRIDPLAGCALRKVELNSAALKLGTPDPGDLDDGHADLDASFEFGCQDTKRAAFIDIALFKAFAGMQRIDVQLATATGQRQRTLRRPTVRVELNR